MPIGYGGKSNRVNIVRTASPFNGLPLHHFGVVLADPPWRFVTRSPKGEGRSACQHYDTMTFDEIAALPVNIVTADDCWLALWVADPHIPLGLKLMEAWGFTFSGKAFTWVKQNPSGSGWHLGLGFTTRKNTESCWLGRRGKPKRLSKGVRELIIAPRREHSRKPDEIYERVERLASGPFLELARQRRSGWASWGDQVDLFDHTTTGETQ